jgi:hypothetical protein
MNVTTAQALKNTAIGNMAALVASCERVAVEHESFSFSDVYSFADGSEINIHSNGKVHAYMREANDD